MSEGGEASAPSPHPAQGQLGSSSSECKQSVVPLTLMGVVVIGVFLLAYLRS